MAKRARGRQATQPVVDEPRATQAREQPPVVDEARAEQAAAAEPEIAGKQPGPRQRAMVRLERPYHPTGSSKWRSFLPLSELPAHFREQDVLPKGTRIAYAEEPVEYPNYFVNVEIHSARLPVVPDDDPLPFVGLNLEPMTDSQLQEEAERVFNKVKDYHRCPICWNGRKGKAQRGRASRQNYGVGKTRVGYYCDACGHRFAYVVTTTRILCRDDADDFDITNGGQHEPKIVEE